MCFLTLSVFNFLFDLFLLYKPVVQKIEKNLFRSLDPPLPASCAPRNCVDTPIFSYPQGRAPVSFKIVNCQASKQVDVNIICSETKYEVRSMKPNLNRGTGLLSQE